MPDPLVDPQMMQRLTAQLQARDERERMARLRQAEAAIPPVEIVEGPELGPYLPLSREEMRLQPAPKPWAIADDEPVYGDLRLRRPVDLKRRWMETGETAGLRIPVGGASWVNQAGRGLFPDRWNSQRYHTWGGTRAGRATTLSDAEMDLIGVATENLKRERAESVPYGRAAAEGRRVEGLNLGALRARERLLEESQAREAARQGRLEDTFGTAEDRARQIMQLEASLFRDRR